MCQLLLIYAFVKKSAKSLSATILYKWDNLYKRYVVLIMIPCLKGKMNECVFFHFKVYWKSTFTSSKYVDTWCCLQSQTENTKTAADKSVEY